MTDAPPYHEDFFQRIVNVNWSVGPVFIYGTQLGNELHYVKLTGKDGSSKRHSIVLPEPATIIDYGAKALFGVIGSSYAKIKGVDVLLVCGTASNFHEITDDVGNTTGAIDRHTVIYASNDGLNWGIVHEEAAIVTSFHDEKSIESLALVWNPDKSSFYYDQFSGGVGGSGEEVFSSSDGTGWGRSGAGFVDQCVNNDCFDSLGQHVPDGVMQYDLKTQTTAKPDLPPTIFYDSGAVSYDPGSGDVIVTKHPPGGQITVGFSSTVSMPGIGRVTCVAGYNGIFMAGGYTNDSGEGPGAVALSVDGGATWSFFAGTSTGVTTMIAAPLQ